MNKFQYIYIVLFFLSFCLLSCAGNSSNSESNTDSVATIKTTDEVNKDIENISKNDSTKTEEATDALGVEYTAKYICPNHCKGSGSDKAGVCSNSECGMDLMENPNYKEN